MDKCLWEKGFQRESGSQKDPKEEQNMVTLETGRRQHDRNFMFIWQINNTSFPTRGCDPATQPQAFDQIYSARFEFPLVDQASDSIIVVVIRIWFVISMRGLPLLY